MNAFAEVIRSGQMIWMAGRLDVGEQGQVAHPDDFEAQTVATIQGLRETLNSVDANEANLVKLLCFVVGDLERREELLAHLAAALPKHTRPAVTVVPVPYLAVRGALLQIDALAMLGTDVAAVSPTYSDPTSASSLPPGFASGVRAGKMIFVSGQAAVKDEVVEHPDDIVAQTRVAMRQIQQVLAGFGADFGDVVKVNRWYLGHGTVQDFEPAALACAAYFSEPGPAATGIPVPRMWFDGQQITIEVIAMLGEDGTKLPRRHAWPETLWDWTVHLPYHHGIKCDDMIFLGGQVALDKLGTALHPDQLAEQTRAAMVHIGIILGDLGASYDDICKLTTMYEASADSGRHQLNLDTRASFFDRHRPASTQIPLPALAYPHMIIEIDAFAMAPPDRPVS